MKKLFFLTAVFCLMAVSAFAQKNVSTLGQGKAADFSGTWSLDTGKSTLDQRARIESMTMTVAQSAGSIKVDTETKRQAPPADAPQGGMGRGGGGMFGGGDGSTTYMLDGKETTIQQETRMGSIPVKLTGKVEGSKLQLSRVSTFNGPNGELTMTNKETWSLSDDGKTLTVQREMTSPRGTNASTLVFVKK